VTEIRPTGQTMATQTGFDIREYLGRKWLRDALQTWMDEAPVKIRLTRRQADRLRQDWYYRQAVFEPMSETETLLTIGSDDVEAVLELLRWLGVGAQLVEPAGWRGLMKAQLTQMLASYAEDDPSTSTGSTG
jgi:hypothetical protein